MTATQFSALLFTCVMIVSCGTAPQHAGYTTPTPPQEMPYQDTRAEPADASESAEPHQTTIIDANPEYAYIKRNKWGEYESYTDGNLAIMGGIALGAGLVAQKGLDGLEKASNWAENSAARSSNLRSNSSPGSNSEDRRPSTVKDFTVTFDARANQTGDEAGASGVSSLNVKDNSGSFTVYYYYNWPSSYLIEAGRNNDLTGKSVRIYFEGDTATFISCSSGNGKCRIKSFTR